MSAQVLILDSEQKRDRAASIVSRLPVEKPIKLTVEPFRAQRSQTANRRLWALHQRAADFTGMSAEDMHEIALCRFYGYEEKKLGGIIRQVPIERSSVKNTAEFTKFMEATESWYIQEFGVFLE